MALVPYKYLTIDRDRHGNVRVYFRHGRMPKVRMREPLDTPQFAARYAELLERARVGLALVEKPKPRGRPQEGTFAAVALAYTISPAFKALDATTQRTQRGIIHKIIEEPAVPGEPQTFADFPISRMTTEKLAILRDRKAHLPGAANNRVRVLRAIFKWAKKPYRLTINPAEDLDKLSYATDGFYTWTVADIETYEKRHQPGTKAHLALMLLLYTGGRRSDVPRLGRQHVANGRIRWLAHKNRNLYPTTLDLPLLPPLATAIEAGAAGKLLFMETQAGKSFTVNGWGNWFKDRCLEAGLHRCSAHGIRKAAATLAAENGATSHELMAMFGWRKLSQAEVYTRTADKKRLATSGMGKILRTPLSHIGSPVGKTVKVTKQHQ